MKIINSICRRGFTLLRQEAMWFTTGMITHHFKGVIEAAMEDRMAGQDGVLGFCRRQGGYGGQVGGFRKSFTLVEVMIAVALFSLVVAGSAGVYIMCQKFWHATTLSMDTVQMASLAMERMVCGLGSNTGLRSAYSIVADTNKHKCTSIVNYWDTTTSSPPAATHGANSLCTYAPYPGDGSWRIIYSNALDGVKYIDYIKKQRSIVLWPVINNTLRRLSICNYVSDARIDADADGISINLTVWKKDGMFVVSNQVSMYIKKRNN